MGVDIMRLKKLFLILLVIFYFRSVLPASLDEIIRGFDLPVTEQNRYIFMVSLGNIAKEGDILYRDANGEQDDNSSNKKYLLLLLGLFSFGGISLGFYNLFPKLFNGNTDEIKKLQKEYAQNIKETEELHEKVAQKLTQECKEATQSSEKVKQECRLSVDALDKKINDYIKQNSDDLQAFSKEADKRIKEALSEAKNSKNCAQKYSRDLDREIEDLEKTVAQEKNEGFFGSLFSFAKDNIDFTKTFEIIRETNNVGKTVQNIAKACSGGDSESSLSSDKKDRDLQDRLDRLHQVPRVPAYAPRMS